MDKTFYYSTLKFVKTKYRFRNGKARDRYFGKVVIEDIYEYRRQFREYMHEKLHVICTWQETLKYASFLVLGLALVFLALGMAFKALLITFGISLLLVIGALACEHYFSRYAESVHFTSAFMDDDNYLENVREIALEEEND